jgi:carboxymethylenebutenolidase
MGRVQGRNESRDSGGLRPGGSFTQKMQIAGQGESTFSGTYEDVIDLRRIVSTASMGPPRNDRVFRRRRGYESGHQHKKASRIRSLDTRRDLETVAARNRWYYLGGSQPVEPTEPKLPSEAIELYNDFIHGEISRRAFIEGVQRLAGGLAAATIINALMPNYALGQQVSRTDDRIKATYETVPSPKGNGSIKGYLVRPVSADTRSETVTKLPGVIVVHENRGLNPHIEDIARRFALANFMAFAPDGLTSLGGYPGDDYKGGQMFNKIDKNKMSEDMVAAAMWLKSRSDCTGKICATGFCYGGSTANMLAVRLGADLAAAAPFYGGPPAPEDIPKIKAAILVHHGELDTRLAATWPAYDQALNAAHVPHEGYIYPGAVHGFNCDATPERYNKAAADLAWQRTIDWFNKYVRG